MNYVGEIMLYASFGVIVQRWETWLIFAYMWGVIFTIRMSLKDYSLAKKDGFKEYAQETWMLVPKLFNSTEIALGIYAVVLGLFYFVFSNGGIEATLRLI